MALQFFPGPWRIMLCDFNTGFQEPEMIKRRPVISISKRRRDGAQLCTVIPISSTPPDKIRDFHYLLPDDQMPHHLRGQYPEHWVKVDMVTTVAFFRLTLLWHGRDQHGQRVYQTSPIALEHRIEISNRLISRFALVRLDE